LHLFLSHAPYYLFEGNIVHLNTNASKHGYDVQFQVTEIQTDVEIFYKQLPDRMSEMELAESKRLFDDVGFEQHETVLEIQRIESERGLPEQLFFAAVDESNIDLLHVNLHVVQQPVYYVAEVALLFALASLSRLIGRDVLCGRLLLIGCN
jgi:hypothetical protein